jgi:hypothetical protein
MRKPLGALGNIQTRKKWWIRIRRDEEPDGHRVPSVLSIERLFGNGAVQLANWMAQTVTELCRRTLSALGNDAAHG